LPPRFYRLLALAAVLLAAGCTSESGAVAGRPAQPAAEPRIATTTASSSSGAVVTLPLDAYVPTAEQWEVLNRASGLLERDCMRRLGFSDWQPPAPQVADGRARMFPFGIVDEQQAARHGYHDPRAAAVSRMVSQQPRRTAEQRARDRAELAALTGDSAFGTLAGRQVPPGGCSGEADRKLRAGAPSHDVDLYGQLVTEANQRTFADSRVRAVIEAWSTCMGRAGFHYDSPVELAQPESSLWPTPKPTRAEIATAKADVTCKKQTNLPSVWLKVTAAYQQQLIERHKLSLDQVARDLEHRVRQANETLKRRQG
jgi:hypothetical protein